MATHLSIIPAASAPRALIFRRGPGKRVRQILWHLDTDRFELGQWLAGRVYAPRSDLSPDGRLMVYFGNRRGDTWTAVCRPPHFTPLAAWTECGTYGGGGRFASNQRLLLQTNPVCMPLQEGYALPAWFTLGCTWYGAEKEIERTWGASGVHPRIESLKLETSPTLDDDGNRPRDLVVAQLIDLRADRVYDLGIVDWCGWGPKRRGDLLYAKNGCIWRVRMRLRGGVLEEIERTTKMLADFSDDRFDRMPPTPAALRWPAPPADG